jgi:DNA-binding NarL/FixJ family response regulator
MTVGKHMHEGNNLNVRAQQFGPPKGICVDKIRLVLADDHREVMGKVRGILGDEFEVVETAENGRQAVFAVLALDPDVLAMDISMPFLDGLQAARSMQKTNCRAKIVFLTIHEDRDFIAAAPTWNTERSISNRSLKRSKPVHRRVASSSTSLLRSLSSSAI